MSGEQGGWSAYWEGLVPRQRIFEAEARDLVLRLEPVLAADVAGLRAGVLPGSLTYRNGRMTVALEHAVPNDAAE